MKNTFLIFSLVLLVVASCRRGGDSQRLDDINALTEASRPDSALTLLSEINADSLSKAEGAYFSLLKIKAADKAYIRHTSDSAIMEVLKYYEDHKSDVHYPEALYYGGRVYSDLGDYPSALRYFQEALVLLPENTTNLKLRGNVLSQLAWILNALRLYDQSLNYLSLAIELEEIQRDTLNLFYDLRQKGIVLMNSDRYEEANATFDKAEEILNSDLNPHKATIQAYKAAIKYKTGDIESALNLIRNVPENIDNELKWESMAFASQIYADANLYDTASMYAMQLINKCPTINQKVGYDLLLNTEISKSIHPDSISIYNKRYSRLIQQFADNNDSEESLIQNSIYNYNIHVREKGKAEIKKQIFRKYLIIISTSCGVIIILLLIIYINNRNRIISLYRRIEKLQVLRHSLNENNNIPLKKTFESKHKKLKSFTIPSAEERRIREQYKSELLNLINSSEKEKQLNPIVRKSSVYKEIIQMLSKSEIIPFDSDIWNRLDEIVLGVSPDFRNHLELLLGEKISRVNYQYALLLKCHFRQIDISKLCGREKNSISSRKNKMIKLINDERIDNKIFEKIIKLM